MEFIKTEIEGLLLVRPKRFGDSRGYFMETYNEDVFRPHIGDIHFIQDNESESVCGVLRGLHLQAGDSSQAKLVRVVSGAVYDVAVDLRPGSPTFGRWHAVELNDSGGLMMFIPRGFAHGFTVLSQRACFAYKVDNRYDPSSEVTIAFDDPGIGVEWPVPADGKFILSEKDSKAAVSFADYVRAYIKY